VLRCSAFVEVKRGCGYKGAKRSTTGEFVWTLQGKEQFSGSFTSTAANSHGTSVGKRIKTQ
jgi:hypothetical protein